uniref:Uncharacterized protein n=1 Tax=Anopheles christyi TaxID=43041 RepID=A0A182KII9_9DIPT
MLKGRVGGDSLPPRTSPWTTRLPKLN